MNNPRVTVKKYQGDDTQSWAVFLDGKVVQGLTGLNSRQARHYRVIVENRIATIVENRKRIADAAK